MLIGQCLQDITISHGLVVSLLLAGLVGGFTHCTGMCSPFILAQAEGSAHAGKLRSSLLLPYHFGRMTTYVMLAILVNSVINLAFIASDLKALIAAPMLALAAVIFLVSAFPVLSSVFPWAAHIRISVPYQFFSSSLSRLTRNPGVLGRYGLGVLLGFMPCGLVVSALLAAGTASSAVQAGAAMAAFALGTMPALILVGLGGNALRYKYPNLSRRVSQGAMVISSLWLFGLAGLMIF